jgi:anaerobic selenocysteine-containing dehydrogenase
MSEAKATADGRIRTYCRMCDPQCGLIATVKDGRVVKIEGDNTHVLSSGHLCPKSVAAADVMYDPDRILKPLKRIGGPGEFVTVTWDDAMTDITRRLIQVRSSFGSTSFATFLGNPPSHGFATALWFAGLQATLGVKWRYAVNSDDAASRLMANALLFGTTSILLKPDLWRCDFLIIIGANPYVSNGSLVCEPHLRDALSATVARGGRVVVIDPRRSETAQHFEHVPVRPGTDAFLLIGMVLATLEAGLTDQAFLASRTSGFEKLTSGLAVFSIEECAERSGVGTDVIRSLACDFARAKRGAIYGRVGTCQQRFGTLNNFLQDVLNTVSGKIDSVGGMVPGWDAMEAARPSTSSSGPGFGRAPTRVFGHPDIAGMHPSTSLAPDIVTEGPEQVRALMTLGCNPVLSSAGGGAALAAALEKLDLHFSLDLYVNETNRHAHYILPVAHMYERADMPLSYTSMMLRPSLWYSEAVTPPLGEAREEWQIMQEIAQRMGFGGAYASRWMRMLAKWGVEIKPETLADIKIRNSVVGDGFGLRPRGLNLRKLRRRYPNGIQFCKDLPVGRLWDRIQTVDQKIDLAPQCILTELQLLKRHQSNPAFPLRLIGMREIRSINSWLHNVARVMPVNRRQWAHLHPKDASDCGVEDGEDVLIFSETGQVQMPVKVTDEVAPGTVAIPHGWGHNGGWRVANAVAGTNSNILASGDRADIERLAGMSILTGIPIRISAASTRTGASPATGQVKPAPGC